MNYLNNAPAYFIRVKRHQRKNYVQSCQMLSALLIPTSYLPLGFAAHPPVTPRSTTTVVSGNHLQSSASDLHACRAASNPHEIMLVSLENPAHIFYNLLAFNEHHKIPATQGENDTQTPWHSRSLSKAELHAVYRFLSQQNFVFFFMLMIVVKLVQSMSTCHKACKGGDCRLIVMLIRWIRREWQHSAGPEILTFSSTLGPDQVASLFGPTDIIFLARMNANLISIQILSSAELIYFETQFLAVETDGLLCSVQSAHLFNQVKSLIEMFASLPSSERSIWSTISISLSVSCANFTIPLRTTQPSSL